MEKVSTPIQSLKKIMSSSSLPTAHPTSQIRYNSPVTRKRCSGSVFDRKNQKKNVKNETKSTSKISSYKPKIANKSERAPFEPYSSDTMISALNSTSPIFQIAFFRTFVFLVLTIIFACFSILEFHKVFSTFCALMFFVFGLLSAYFEPSTKTAISSIINFLFPGDSSSENALQKRNAQAKNAVNTVSPHKIFITNKETVYSEADDTKMTPSLYKPFEVSDRPTSSQDQNVYNISSESTLEQNANKSLQNLDLTYTEYSQYVSNLKTFIAKNVLKKLVMQIHEVSNLTEPMLSIPGYESYRGYVVQRIKELAESPILSTHQGDSGGRYEDREWNDEMPSDNQIVFNVLSTWISFFMGSRKPDYIENRFRNKFTTRSHITTHGKKDDSKDIILLCIEESKEEKTRYSIIFQGKEKEEFYWAFPGLDSMYSGLTLFFYIVNKYLNNSLDGADFQDDPINFSSIFTMKKYE